MLFLCYEYIKEKPSSLTIQISVHFVSAVLPETKKRVLKGVLKNLIKKVKVTL